MSPQRFVLLDRDGTVIAERHYLADPDLVELIPGAAGALRRLKKLGLGLAMITNQSGIGRGFFDQAQLDRIHRRMCELLEQEGVVLDGIYVCPHTPADGCQCRKPRGGLIEQAVKEHGFDPGAAFVVGDKVVDIELGRSVGAMTLLVRTGYGEQVVADGKASADYVVDDLAGAAQLIDGILTDPEKRGVHGSVR